MKEKIINIAVIAHVDAGKSTLVDAFLSQSGVFRDNEEVVDCIMDSNDLERERGITIYSKNCSIMYKGIKINVIDTPGHADFSSEVERVIKSVDTVILLVDSSEGPMPQTRFVLQKSLEMGLKPILLVNKVDKKDERAEEVVNMVFDMFFELDATEEQLHFPILYGIAKEGIVMKNMDDESNDITPLIETIVEHTGVYPDLDEEDLQLQIFDLAYDDYIGRLGIGRIYKGKIEKGQNISIYKRNGEIKDEKISQIFTYKGLQRTPVDVATSGDIVIISGIPHISIGETIGIKNKIDKMEMIKIEEPTLSMNFMVNKSPLAGKSGKYLTSRQIRERLHKELEVNVGMTVEELPGQKDAFKVSGRGELHLSILLENLRREGYEIAVSKPEVIFKNEDGKKLEPVEKIVIEVPENYQGVVIEKINKRKGRMVKMEAKGSYMVMEYIVPTRGLIGYKSEFINDTRGEGTLIRRFDSYEEYKGEIEHRKNGVLISQEDGVAMNYSLYNLNERGRLIINSGDEVYEGMVIGICNRSEDMVVNPCKNKKLTNMRSSGSDDSLKIQPPIDMNLEDALEFIEDDELVEITPDSIRVRKKLLKEIDRRKQRN
ncbi:MAG: translational GTPase TypA [Bacillota bacterium]|nr:translational GTPase TypA [Bacillota bacterium]